VHNSLREGLADSPLYNGQIQSIGPRYCPSIETKLQTFPERTHHPLFLEPEGNNTNALYLNGFSSSLPLDVQLKALHKIPAFAQARIFRPGYAIEYDFFDPTQLFHSLESKVVDGLFLAGQVNGTTGYEEAAGQGLVAGINAALKCSGSKPFVMHRDESYIGVLIDDLVTKGVDEPYRMFTSRAEYRILLRQDNADQRLTPHAKRLGLISTEESELFETKQTAISDLIHFCQNHSIKPRFINEKLSAAGSTPLTYGCKLSELIARPELSVHALSTMIPAFRSYLKSIPSQTEEIIETAEIEMKYSGYIQRQQQEAEKMHRLENIRIRGHFNYNDIQQLSTEARQKLTRINPDTLAQASRIPGVSPSDINVLLVLMKR
jgi:tRNA uridine 5-carboxymethylaminomethyl modification enzyme